MNISERRSASLPSRRQDLAECCAYVHCGKLSCIWAGCQFRRFCPFHMSKSCFLLTALLQTRSSHNAQQLISKNSCGSRRRFQFTGKDDLLGTDHDLSSKSDWLLSRLPSGYFLVRRAVLG